MKFGTIPRVLVALAIIGLFVLALKTVLDSRNATNDGKAAPVTDTAQKPLAIPVAPSALSQPATAVALPAIPPQAPPAVRAFREWAQEFALAAPEQRLQMEKSGIELARQHREMLAKLIPTDPKAAIENAVPMVVRQQLPMSILALLEKRLNTRAAVTVYQGSPVPGEPLPLKTLTHRVAQVPGEGAYNLHVYGRRAESVLNVPNAAINGISIDRNIAANEEPLRVLEPGEVPNAAKPKVAVCPVSGKTTLDDVSSNAPITADQTDSVVETPEEIVYLCGGYHKPIYAQQMVYGEGTTGGPTTITGALPAAPTPALGMCKVLYIPMTFQDQNAVPATESTCYQVMRDVADYYSKSSFGKLTTLSTVTPPVKLPKNEAWYVQRDTSNGGDVDGLSLEMSHAREEARRLGYNYEDYDCTVLRLSGGARPAGGWGGGSTVWIYGDSVVVTAHEVGHAFGLAHANYWDTAGTSAIGPGANAEYGDQYDVMGGGGVPKDHYNAAAKNQIKWLPDNYVQNVTASGLYRLHAMDQPMLDPRNSYALTITKDSQHTYWGELRQNYTGDASRPWVDKGMLLGWKYSSGGGGNIQLIDTTPGSPFGKDDAPIALGQTFGDTEAGIFMTTVGVSSTTPKYVDVVVNMGDFSSNHAPTLTLASNADSIPTSATVTFTATASDADGDALAYQWQHWGDTSTRLVSPNSPTITRTFNTAGTYVVSCTVSDMKGGTVIRSKLITVGNGGGRFTISGRVTANGAGLPGVLLNANNTNPVITDNDGYYIIANLTANTYTVTPLLYGCSFSELFNNSITVGPNFSGANFDASVLPSVSITAIDATATENNAGDTATFRLTRTGDITQALTVNVNPANGTASTSDYTLNPALAAGSGGFSTFTIPADRTTLDIVVATTNDTIAEGPETLPFALGSGAGYLVGANGGAATITIEDDDTILPKLSITATASNTVEGSATPAVFTLKRSGSTTSALTVNYAISGTATSGSDFTALSGTFTFNAGQASGTINVLSLDDTSVESLETVVTTLSTNAAYLVSPAASAATTSIIDDDTNVLNVTATDAVATEVDLTQSGAVADTGTFVITRSGDTTLPLTIYYSVAGSQSAGVPALNGVDYEALAGVVQIPAGSASASVTIIPRWDAFGETPEQVLLQLGAGPTNYKLGANNSATVILNDSATSNAPYVEVTGTVSASEPSTAGKFRFSLKGSIVSPATVSIPFAIGGTATVTTDYTVTLPTVPAGSTFDAATGTGVLVMTASAAIASTLDLTITPVNDAALEDLETVTCTLTPSASFTSFGPTSTASIWLRDDDQPTLWADSQCSTGGTNRITEGAVTTMKFYVSRTGATTSALTVNFSLQGTATPGTDYTVTTSGTLTFDNAARTGVLTIPAGSSGADVALSMSTTNDTTAEGTETVIFHAEAGAYSRTQDASLFIDDNDTFTQSVRFSSTGSSASENAGTVSIPVTLASAATAPVSVEYVIDGSRTSTAVGIGAGALALPYWMRVARTPTALVTSISSDGVNWHVRQNLSLSAINSSGFVIGLATGSGTSGQLATATFDNVSVTNLATGGSQSALTQTDIGSPAPAGSSSVVSGTYTVAGGFAGLTGNADTCRFVGWTINNSSTATLTARITALSGGGSGSRAGVVIRDSTAANSRNMALISGTILGSHYTQSRTSTNGSTSTSVNYGFPKPYWLRLQRAGTSFALLGSMNGTAFTSIASGITVPMGSTVAAGLWVSAKSDGGLSTATFDNVTISTVASPTFTGRSIGYVNAQGSDSQAGGVFTITGSGDGASGSFDEGYFVSAPVSGDFTLTARVTSASAPVGKVLDPEQPASDAAEVGLMVRENFVGYDKSIYGGVTSGELLSMSYQGTAPTNAFGQGVDHTLGTGVLNFGIGDLTKNITFNLTDDTIPEGNEQVTVVLRGPVGAALGTPSTHSFTIDDNDVAPALPFAGFAAASTAVTESAGTVNLDVTLSAPAASTVSVDYASHGRHRDQRR